MTSQEVSSSDDLRRNSAEDRTPLELNVVIDGILNNCPVLIDGTGTLDEYHGISKGSFDIVHLPDDIEAAALGAFLFTGYPNSCDCQSAGLVNPFVGHDYWYTRSYNFKGSSAKVELRMACTLSSERLLTAHFSLSGKMPALRDVQQVSPISETWIATEAGLDGRFDVCWLSDDGQTLAEAETHSNYHIADWSIGSGPYSLHRDIRLTSTTEAARRFSVYQVSALIAGKR